MHASLWRFRGDPEELLRGYETMLGDVPAESMRMHLGLRAPDGIVVVDTCPSREAFESFVRGRLADLLRHSGLPAPQRVEDFPVAAAFVDGGRRT